ncbi:MAG: ferrous iron transport protein A [Lachnospiraceae bacterium]|nr:ferrous iron transport protein A [Lachnospiraceae bacterium]
MTLYEGKIGSAYIVKGIHLKQNSIVRRLEALGLNEMTKLQIQNSKRRGALIIKVRGTRLAVGKQIAQGIEVEEVKENA